MNRRKILIILLALSLILTLPGLAYGAGSEEKLAEVEKKAQEAEKEAE